MSKFSLLCLFLLAALTCANLQCDLCKLVVGTAESGLTGDKELQRKLSDKFVEGCDQIVDESARETCEVLFSAENFPLLAANVAKAVGVTKEEICQGIGSC